MKKTANESNSEGRIVILSSEGHRYAYREGIRFDKINDEARWLLGDIIGHLLLDTSNILLLLSPFLCSYNTIQAYGQSKLCNILHATELARQFKVH